MLKMKVYTIVIIVFALILGCSEKADDEDPVSFDPPNGDNGNNKTVLPTDCSQFGQPNDKGRLTSGSMPLSVQLLSPTEIWQNDKGNYFESHSFTLPDDVISFQISTFENGNIGICSLTDSGQTKWIKNDICYIQPTFYTTWEPSLPYYSITSGKWELIAVGGTQSFQTYLGIKSGTLSDQPILYVQTFLAGKYTKSQVQPALERFVEIYSQNGVAIELDTISEIEEGFSVVDADFANSNTIELVCKGYIDAVNLFLIEDFTGEDENVLGIASGVPGPQGIWSGYNGVLIGLTAHEITTGISNNTPSDPFHTSLLGETIAHEVGHWLGLYHTTETSGEEFDSLYDTSQCPIEMASTPRNGVSVQDCLERDGLNLMFWLGDPNYNQTVLTPDQLSVLKKAPIVR